MRQAHSRAWTARFGAQSGVDKTRDALATVSQTVRVLSKPGDRTKISFSDKGNSVKQPEVIYLDPHVLTDPRIKDAGELDDVLCGQALFGSAAKHVVDPAILAGYGPKGTLWKSKGAKAMYMAAEIAAVDNYVEEEAPGFVPYLEAKAAYGSDAAQAGLIRMAMAFEEEPTAELAAALVSHSLSTRGTSAIPLGPYADAVDDALDKFEACNNSAQRATTADKVWATLKKVFPYVAPPPPPMPSPPQPPEEDEDDDVEKEKQEQQQQGDGDSQDEQEETDEQDQQDKPQNGKPKPQKQDENDPKEAESDEKDPESDDSDEADPNESDPAENDEAEDRQDGKGDDKEDEDEQDKQDQSEGVAGQNKQDEQDEKDQQGEQDQSKGAQNQDEPESEDKGDKPEDKQSSGGNDKQDKQDKGDGEEDEQTEDKGDGNEQNEQDKPTEGEESSDKQDKPAESEESQPREATEQAQTQQSQETREDEAPKSYEELMQEWEDANQRRKEAKAAAEKALEAADQIAQAIMSTANAESAGKEVEAAQAERPEAPEPKAIETRAIEVGDTEPSGGWSREESTSNVIFVPISIQQAHREAYDGFARSVRREADDLRTKMQFRTETMVEMSYGYRSGELDEGALDKLFTHDGHGSPALFMQRDVIGRAPIAFGLLVDESGSMSHNERFAHARRVAILLREAIKDIPNILPYIWGHTAKGHGDDAKTHIFQYLDPRSDSAAALSQIQARDWNADGYAIWACAERMLQENDPAQVDRRILWVVSDGKPAYHNGEAHTRKMVDQAWRAGVEVYGVGIDNAFTQEFADNLYGENRAIVLPDVDSSAKYIGAFLVRLAQRAIR